MSYLRLGEELPSGNKSNIYVFEAANVECNNSCCDHIRQIHFMNGTLEGHCTIEEFKHIVAGFLKDELIR